MLLVDAQDVAQLFRHRDGDVKIVAGQHLELAGLEPALGLIGVALAAAAVFAAMVGKDLMRAVIALPEVSAEDLGATGQNVADGAAMRWQHGRAMGREVGVRKTTEDVGDLDHAGVRGRSSARQGCP
jgi:hypothetical protein